MRKICTTGNAQLSNFFNEIGIGKENREHNQRLVAPGNSGYLNGTASDTYYYVNSEGRFTCSEEFPAGYGLVPIPDFIEYHRERLNSKPSKMITVTKQDLQKIWNVACDAWKLTIEEYAKRNIFDVTIELTQTEVNAMFKAASPNQTLVLEDVFGKQQEEIDFDRIKTGSRVMIQYHVQHCCGFDDIDESKPVDVVFFKTPHYINNDDKFLTNGSYTSYCTFHQNGKYVLFAAHKNVEYITRVVEY